MTKMPWSLLTEGSASLHWGQEDCCLAVGRGQPRYTFRYQKIDIVGWAIQLRNP